LTELGFLRRVDQVASTIAQNNIEIVQDVNPEAYFGGKLEDRLAVTIQQAIQQPPETDQQIRAGTLAMSASDGGSNAEVISRFEAAAEDALRAGGARGRQMFSAFEESITSQIKEATGKDVVIFEPDSRIEEIRRELFRTRTADEQRAANLQAVQDFLASGREIQERKRQQYRPATPPEESPRSLMARPEVFDDAATVETQQTSGSFSSTEDVEATLQEVSKGFNDSKAATSLLREIAITESNMGQSGGTYDIAVDSKGNRGSLGLAQIDEVAFNEVQRRLRGGKGQNKYTKSSIDKAKKILGVDPTQVSYEDLADDKTNLVFARLYLMSIPDPIPPKVEDRARYWKTHYNTSAGKGTPQKYLERLREFGLDV
jgi:uncharacterized protein YhfF